MVWNEITELEEWEAILEKSVDKDQVILQHSTTCQVSFNELDEYNDYVADTPDTNIDNSLVEVRESCPVSNQIEADLEVKHVSPQIIYNKNKKAYWNTS